MHGKYIFFFMIINIFQHERQQRKTNKDTASSCSSVSEKEFSERQIKTRAARLYGRISQRYKRKFQMTLDTTFESKLEY